MSYGLSSLQTNLCISLHPQSDELWHNGTNYEELLFSSDIWTGYILLQMSTWPDVVLLLAFLMCNLVATTKLQRNNKNNNNKNNNKIELCIIEQNMYVNSYFCSCPFCVSFIILLLLQQHNSIVTCLSYCFVVFAKHNYTLKTTTTNFRSINWSIFSNSYVDWCFYCHCCCYCVILFLLSTWMSAWPKE